MNWNSQELLHPHSREYSITTRKHASIHYHKKTSIYPPPPHENMYQTINSAGTTEIIVQYKNSETRKATRRTLATYMTTGHLQTTENWLINVLIHGHRIFYFAITGESHTRRLHLLPVCRISRFPHACFHGAGHLGHRPLLPPPRHRRLPGRHRRHPPACRPPSGEPRTGCREIPRSRAQRCGLII